ncbi:flagellar hook capping FlgD N-terminal domain-containing protein [Nocardioides ferulae]|uniref:flagellar hook capping FlgD N-terminal domain-containing protein n=1 Tax=Nocardioides ferulae TaxID=2340821 RepID=UPI000EAF7C0B|nr:flagellar hook capping FlgD N-terminal domain-containing protein [Nocardioides ferulae]
MSVTPTEAVTSTVPAGLGAAVPTQSAAEDKQMFLELMVAQLRYQDPLNPTDSGEFLAQSAQFTALEKMQAVADQTAAMVSAQLAFGASGLVGKQISYVDADGAEQSGLVSSVSFGAEGPSLDVGGTTISLGQVVTVVGGEAAASPSTVAPPGDGTAPGDGTTPDDGTAPGDGTTATARF